MIAFVSPLGVLADGYLFSAHMLQHLLLLLIVPLCWVLSLPDTNELPWLNQERFAPLLRTLAKPTVGWVSGLGVMWFWHVPSLLQRRHRIAIPWRDPQHHVFSRRHGVLVASLLTGSPNTIASSGGELSICLPPV